MGGDAKPKALRRLGTASAGTGPLQDDGPDNGGKPGGNQWFFDRAKIATHNWSNAMTLPIILGFLFGAMLGLVVVLLLTMRAICRENAKYKAIC